MTLLEQMAELNAAATEARRALIREFVPTRLGRFLGWFYEWERVRIGDRLAKVATVLLAFNLVYTLPIAIITAVLDLIGFGRS